MFDIRQIIYESVKRALLKEGLSKVLYHFTGIRGGFNICKEDTIYLQSAYAKESDNYDKKRKFYLSCTRLFSSQFGYSRKFSMGGVRIKLDGDKLAQRFKGKSVNYWKGLNDKYYYYEKMPKNKEEFKANIRWYVEQFKKKHPDATEDDVQHYIDYNFNRTAQEHIDNESEDRILSYEPSIENAHEYILSVDVLLPNLMDDEESQRIAYSFKANTPLGHLVRIFDSVKEFNNLKGQPIDIYDIIKDKTLEKDFSGRDYRSAHHVTKDGLKKVILFIAYANHDFDGKKFGPQVSRLLQKYNLTQFTKDIGNIQKETTGWTSFETHARNLDAIRRELSDTPNRDNSNILMLLTDYLQSIGANSFREGYLIKKKMVDEYYGHTGNIYDRIDTNVKKEFYIVGYCIIPDPSKTLFADICKYIYRWDDDTIKYTADTLSWEIMNDYRDYTYNKEKTKNNNSMFQYIYKLFRKGTLTQVLDVLHKIGVSDETLNELGFMIEKEQLDFWDACRHDTLNVRKLEATNDNIDYMKKCRLRDKELESVFPKLNNN